jgi:type IV fimbrial biogenesis protein FimT
MRLMSRCVQGKSTFRVSGFTLLELMIVVSIAGILLAIAVPSFNEGIRNNRLTTYANDLVTALNLARSEAVKRGISVTVRKVDNGSFTNLGAAANWENGWDVFTDVNDNGFFDAGTDVLIKTYGPLNNVTYPPPAAQAYTLRGHANIASFIRYTTAGTSNNNGSFVICDNRDGDNLPQQNTARFIEINAAGRPRLGADSDNNGVPEKLGPPVANIASCTVSPF